MYRNQNGEWVEDTFDEDARANSEGPDLDDDGNPTGLPSAPVAAFIRDAIKASEIAALPAIPQLKETGVKLLRKIWEQIKDDPRAWNQGDWISTAPLDATVVEYVKEHQAPPWNCGTAYCIAGHTVLAKGARLRLSDVDYLADEVGHRFSTSIVVDPDGDERAVSEYAMDLLELNQSQALVLFGGNNTAWQIECMVRALEEQGPSADLYVAIDDANKTYTSRGKNWEILHGFRGKESPAYAVRAAVEDAFPGQSDELNEKYALLVMIKPGAITAEDTYHARLLNGIVYYNSESEERDGSLDTQNSIVQQRAAAAAAVLNEITVGS